MKKSILKGAFTALVFSSVMMFGQSVSSALSGQTQEVTNSIKTVLTWVMAIIGVVSLVQAILIFTGSSQGEEKLKKAGTWIFMVVFMAVGLAIVQALFK